MSWGRACVPGVLLVLAGVWSVPVLAQIEDIVVTARKTTENLQDVPISIDAISQEEIERKGIRSISDVAQFTPSVQFDESFAQSDTRITIRGLAPTRGRQNVAILVDGIDLSSEAVVSSGGSLLVNQRLLDIERIEVVKGPQNALYGRSAFAGAIQYITKKPAEEFESDISVDVNDQDQYSLNGGVSFPILGEALGVRFNGSIWDEEGFYDNKTTGDSLADEEGFGVSMSTRSAFDNGLTLNFRAEYTHDEGKPTAQAFVPFNTFLEIPDEAKDDLPGVDNAGLAQCWPDFINTVSEQSIPTTDGGGNVTAFSDRSMVERARRIITPELAAQLGFPDQPLAPDDPAAAQVYGDIIAANPSLYPYCEYQTFGFAGKFPDGDDLKAIVGTDPNSPGNDFDGFDRDFWRVALNAELALERGSFNFWGGYLRDDNTETQDTNAFGIPSDSIFGDDNVNTFSFDNDKVTEQTSLEIRYRTDIEGPLNMVVGAQYWNEDVQNDSRSITAQGSGSHCTWQSSTGDTFPLTDDYCPGYTETPILPYQNAAYGFRKPSPVNRETDHWSIYTELDFELAEDWLIKFEGRFSREEIKVKGPVSYDPESSGGPGGLNPCGIFFRACQPFGDWLADGNFFADSFDAQDPDDGPGLIAGIPDVCRQQNPERVQRSIDYGPADDVDGDGEPDGIDTFNPWCTGRLDTKENWFLPKVTLDWQAQDDMLLYASWAKARKPGGYSLLTVGSSFLDEELAEFAPEKQDVWEVGAKTEWLDSTIRLNGAFFFQDFQDKQALTSVLSRSGERIVSKTVNAAEASVWGAEVDVTWAPVAEFIGGSWTVSGGYQWLDSEYNDFQVANGSISTTTNGGNCTPVVVGGSQLCSIDYSGNDLENAPEGSFVGQLRYARELPSDLSFYIETDVQWTDKRYSDITNNFYTDEFWNADFRVGLQAETWEVLAYVDNVFDDDTVRSSGGGPGLGCCFVLGSSLDFTPGLAPEDQQPRDAVMVDLPLYRSAFLPPPRVFGLRANYRFGGT
jgi:outer membrane receptor protein involved in Fe transport